MQNLHSTCDVYSVARPITSVAITPPAIPKTCKEATTSVQKEEEESDVSDELELEIGPGDVPSALG